MMTTLKIEDIVVEGRKPSGQWFPIVHKVSAEAKPGKVTALIGESGAGKTTVALVALGYSRPGTRIVQGHAYLGDVDILTLNREQRREIRGVRVAYVAQSASASLNPAIPLGEQVAEGLLVHGISSTGSGLDRVLELFKLLDLPHPESIFQRYPHQVSGGQQQRVMIAMAMACMPEFLILDEPTTALDVTTQIEVLKAVKDVIREKGTGAIYVSHDLSVVEHISTRVAVMYLGTVCELAQTKELFASPRHPYTQALLSAIPELGRQKPTHVKLKGEVPTPIDLPPGCVFHARCLYMNERCIHEVPRLIRQDSGTQVACHGVKEGRI